MSAALVAADGTPLAWYGWGVAASRGVVVLVHGLGEHLGRHRIVAERLAAAGWRVVGADLRGHGRSGGPRGHVARFDDYLDDLLLVWSAAGREGVGRPLVLLGHSLGALVALRLVERRRLHDLAGLVLSGIGLLPTVRLPAWKRVLSRIGRWVAPRLPVANEIDPAALSCDPAVQRAYVEDPLVHRVVTPGWFREFEAARRAALAEAARVTVPVLLVHGGADAIVSAEGTRRLAQALTGAEVTLRVYPAARHEVLTDPTCAESLADLEAWLDRVGARPLQHAS